MRRPRSLLLVQHERRKRILICTEEIEQDELIVESWKRVGSLSQSERGEWEEERRVESDARDDRRGSSRGRKWSWALGLGWMEIDRGSFLLLNPLFDRSVIHWEIAKVKEGPV